MSGHAHEKQAFRSLNEGLDKVDDIDGSKASFKSKYDQQIAEMRKNGRKRDSGVSKTSGALKYSGGDL